MINYHIKKELFNVEFNVNKLNSNWIKIYDYDYNNEIYHITIKESLFNRIKKLHKIYNNNKINNLINFFNYIEKHNISFSDLMNSIHTKHLIKEIDKLILEKLRDFSDK